MAEPETNVWSQPDGAAAYAPAQPYPPYQTYPPQQYVVTSTMGYGVDPLSGQPYSAKSKVTAGVLQLLPGFLFSLGGIGRLYAGNTMIGVLQLVATLIGWVSFWCGFVLVIPFLLFAAIWLWFVIDGIVMLAGRPVDGQGLPLRP
jgi:TM2 domain-containing membrane protein YozV